MTGKAAPVSGALGWFDMKWLSRLGRRFTSARALCVALLFALMFLRVTDPRPARRASPAGLRYFPGASSRATPTQRPVVIVDIDEESLRKLGQWPWPRTRVADLITRLTKLGAAAIAFDVVFSEPDRLSPALAADVFRDLDEETRNKLRALPSNDQVMADAISSRGWCSARPACRPSVPQPDVAIAVCGGVAALGGDPKPFVYEFPGLLRNIPILENAAAGRGAVQHPHRARRHRPARADGDAGARQYHAVAVVRDAAGGDRLQHHLDPDGRRPASRASPCPVSKCRPTATASSGSISRRTIRRATCPPSIVLEGRVAADRVSRRLVLIGTSAAGLLDLKTTPNDPAMPGVEVHAQVLESILSNSMLSAPNYAVVAELGAAFVLGVAIIVLAPILGADLSAAVRRSLHRAAGRRRPGICSRNRSC